MPLVKSRSVNARSSSCALIAVASLEMRGKSRIDGGQLPHPLPDSAQRDERRLFGVVQLGIRLAAQPLDRVGAAEQLAIGGQRLILTRLQVGALQFAQLELDQIEPGRTLSIVHSQPIDLFPESTHGGMGRGDRVSQRVEPGPGIKQGKVLRRDRAIADVRAAREARPAGWRGP